MLLRKCSQVLHTFEGAAVRHLRSHIDEELLPLPSGILPQYAKVTAAVVEKGSSTPVGRVAIWLCQLGSCYWPSTEAQQCTNQDVNQDATETCTLFFQLARL